MKRQTGFTLVELMIALLLGLVITLASIQLILTNQRTFSLQQALTAMYEDTYAVTRYINTDLRQAGRGTATTGSIAPIIFESLDPDEPISVTRNNTSDDLVITFVGLQDCEGVGDNSEKTIINHYFVDSGVLRCRGSESTSANGVELLAGVERFHVLFGVDTVSDGQMAVSQFVPASSLTSNSVVVAIRYSILMRSDVDNLPLDTAVRQFYVLDKQVTIQPNRTLYRSFTSTVQLRNFNWSGV